MKQYYFLVITVVTALTIVCASCKEKEVHVKEVVLNQTELELSVGATATLTASVSPDNAADKTIIWSSDNTNVATVSNGFITAIAEGTAIITVTTNDGNKTAHCTLSVKAETKPPHPAEPEMVFVAGGSFTMGCTAEQGSDCDADEIQHTVTLSSFNIAKHPVTQKQWEAIMGTTLQQQHQKYGSGVMPIVGEGDDYPMYFVSWVDVQEFIKRLNAATGKNYRLPTEAEWEYAARGGNQSKGYKYSGSNNIDEVAWYDVNSQVKTHPVGTKAANELGIYDMSGNVWEWCRDWLGEYTDLPQKNPERTEMSPWGAYRAIRGGALHVTSKECRVSQRGGRNPDDANNAIGFRLVLP